MFHPSPTPLIPMTAADSAQILKDACIAPEIFQLRPDYRALLLEAENKSFGTKPKKTRNSLEALSQRITKAGGGLPRVNRLTDIYNAVSVKHQIPLGGEDLDKYEGAPFLVRASWSEPFQAFSGVVPQIEYAAPGEPIWCDGAGITCRRWNWRQGPRTRVKW